jgi:hypothetical protein
MSPPAGKRSKYQPLADWLATQAQASVTLTFGHIERILGTRLPRTGWHRANWWRHGGADCPHLHACGPPGGRSPPSTWGAVR